MSCWKITLHTLSLFHPLAFFVFRLNFLCIWRTETTKKIIEAFKNLHTYVLKMRSSWENTVKIPYIYRIPTSEVIVKYARSTASLLSLNFSLFLSERAESTVTYALAFLFSYIPRWHPIAFPQYIVEFRVKPTCSLIPLSTLYITLDPVTNKCTSLPRRSQILSNLTALKA